MRVIKATVNILSEINGDDALKSIELAARTCYKSEENITEESAKKLVKNLIESNHDAMLEFYDVTVKFTCDRGVSHELVRHRMASYAQESTRYCNYSKDKFNNQLVFVMPSWCNMPECKIECSYQYNYFGGEEKKGAAYFTRPKVSGDLNTASQTFNWIDSIDYAEYMYFKLLKQGLRPEQARAVLPNSLKTEIVMKANLREWRHFFKLRCAKAAHPDMRYLAIELLKQMSSKIEIVFDDLAKQYID